MLESKLKVISRAMLFQRHCVELSCFFLTSSISFPSLMDGKSSLAYSCIAPILIASVQISSSDKKSYWIRVHPNAFIFSWIISARTLFPNRSHSEVSELGFQHNFCREKSQTYVSFDTELTHVHYVPWDIAILASRFEEVFGWFFGVFYIDITWPENKELCGFFLSS